jgi:NAD(P)-dependent dehydrogenase (short-subunit alcohol dehydrogenase family)
MGRRVVVTGSTRGIGRGFAEVLLERGCDVAISGRRQEAVDLVVADLGERFGAHRVVGAACDVRDASAVQRLWDAASHAFGGVDVWINNAGLNQRRLPLWELGAAEVSAVVDTNLVGTVHGCAVALRGMQAQGSGQIWNMEGFGSGDEQAEAMAVYGASKRAVRYLTRALLRDTKGTSVQVGTLSPGIVRTEMIDHGHAAPERQERAERIFAILGDEVETVTPWLADRILATDRTGAHHAWLTKRKAFARFALAPLRLRWARTAA